MRATMLTGVRNIELHQADDPQIHFPTDAVVTVTASCICGSDLHPYRGNAPTAFPRPIGHEFIGVISEIGADVSGISVGDAVIAPFAISDGTCVHCRHGITTSCIHGSFWGAPDRQGVLAGGGQAEQVRVPLASGTLVRAGSSMDAELEADFLALSDVMGTGHHAAVSAGVGAGSTVVVVGDGAVGLCAVLAAHRLGASRIIAMSRHASRQAVATEFGATDIVANRGEEGVVEVLELLDGVGADCALECVGSQVSFDQALAVTRPVASSDVSAHPSFRCPSAACSVVTLGSEPASPRAGLPAELIEDVMAGAIKPGRVFDLTLPLADVAEGYRAMDERRAIKTLLRP